MRIQTWPHSGLERLLETYITLTVWSVHPPLATFTLLSFLTSNLIITTPSSIFTFDTFPTLLHNHNQPHSLNTNTMFAKQIITSILLAVAMTSVTAAPTVNERDIAIKGLTGGDFHLKQNDVDLVSLPLPQPSLPRSTSSIIRTHRRHSSSSFSGSPLTFDVSHRRNTRSDNVRWAVTLTLALPVTPMEGMPSLTKEWARVTGTEPTTEACSEATEACSAVACSTSRLPTWAETADEVDSLLLATLTEVSSLRSFRSIALTGADLDHKSCNSRQRWCRHAATRSRPRSPAEQRRSCSSAKQRRSRSGSGSRFCSYGWHWWQRLHVSHYFFSRFPRVTDAHLALLVRFRQWRERQR